MSVQATPNWARAKHWVFDMDGTLTVAVHDFAFMRQALGAPEGIDLIAFMQSLPEAEATARMAALRDYEQALAVNAKPAPGAIELIEHLNAHGVALGLLTRNRHDLALTTLKAIGLDGYFAKEHVLGRDECAPKPAPDGLLRLAKQWGTDSRELVMVGDYHYDIDCAKAAGSTGILLCEGANPWPGRCDVHLPNCLALHQAVLSV